MTDKYKCIVCGFHMNRIEGAIDVKDHHDMWNGGGVDLFVPGYGSKLDGNKYVVGICDKCLINKEEQGIIKLIEE